MRERPIAASPGPLHGFGSQSCGKRVGLERIVIPSAAPPPDRVHLVRDCASGIEAIHARFAGPGRASAPKGRRCTR
jgi:hypothetical protein